MCLCCRIKKDMQLDDPTQSKKPALEIKSTTKRKNDKKKQLKRL